VTLLSIVKDASLDLGIGEPEVVVGNTSDEVKQLLSLAKREGKDLASRYRWEGLLREATFTFQTQKDQGTINGTVVSDSDVDYIINDTIWDRSQNIPILGPMSPMLRQAHEAFSISGPYPRYFIRRGKLFFDTVPSANTGAFEYKSKFWCEDENGTGKLEWSADTDVGRLDEDLMTLGLIWRWKRAKGLDYSQEFDTYETRVKDKMGQDGTKRDVSLDNSVSSRSPGLIVPEGNWLQ